MNVKDLRNYLSQYPDDTSLVVAGYEGGYNDLTIAQNIRITRDVYNLDYMGQHEGAEPTTKNSQQAILLSGVNSLARVENE
jgi:hypothetical protein